MWAPTVQACRAESPLARTFGNYNDASPHRCSTETFPDDASCCSKGAPSRHSESMLRSAVEPSLQAATVK